MPYHFFCKFLTHYTVQYCIHIPFYKMAQSQLCFIIFLLDFHPITLYILLLQFHAYYTTFLKLFIPVCYISPSV
jgi:hypothetical protein